MCFDNDADSGEMGGMYEIMTGAELKTAALECVIIMSVEENGAYCIETGPFTNCS
jgi:hypothetical protein